MPTISERQILWQELGSFSQTSSSPWQIGGDLNALLSPDEKLGGRDANSLSISYWKSFLSLVLKMLAGSRFTWFNGQQAGYPGPVGRSYFQPSLAAVFTIHHCGASIKRSLRSLSEGGETVLVGYHS